MSYLSISALLGLLPSVVYAYRAPHGTKTLFWIFMVVAISGTGVLTASAFSEGWRTGFAPTLWATITATLLIYLPVALCFREGNKLAAGLLPYLIVLAVLATIWQNQPEKPFLTDAPSIWVILHIAFSVTTYAVLTLAAIAGFAAFIQERSLKTKQQTFLNTAFPTLSASEEMEARLLQYCAVVLGVGLLTGIAVQFLQTGSVFEISHKVLLSVITFIIVLALLIARKVSGLRGQKAARLALLAYLMLTLAYPGVKFVTDVLVV